MSGFIDAFHFIYPAWLLAIALLPLLLWWLLRQADARNKLASVADAELLPLLVAPSPVTRQWQPWLLSTMWLLSCVALAGPAWQQLPAPAEHSHNARVIVLSLADSMLATDLKPTRLARARYKIRDLLDAGRDARNALVAYAGEAFVVVPLTADSDTVLNFLPSLKPDVMPVSGDRADLGINKAVALLQQAGFDAGDVILVTDHADHKAVAAARRALHQGMHVSVLGAGTDQGSPIALPSGGFLKDKQGNIVIPRLALAQLQKVASAGGGIYRTLDVGDADVQALTRASKHAGTGTADKDSKLKVTRWRDEGPWLLLILVPLAALAFRRGWLMVLALVLVLPTGRAQAAVSWSDLWHNRDQQAAQALAENNPAEALERAKSPGLRGSAAYRKSDFKHAVQAFAEGKDARSKYNLGNALAEQGEYEKAIKAWSEALKMNPDLADARANRKSVQEWLKRQRKQKPEGKQDSRQEGGEQSEADKSQQGSSAKNTQNGDDSKSGKQSSKPDQDNEDSSGSKGEKPGEQSTPNGKPESSEAKNDDSRSPGQPGKPSGQSEQPSSPASMQAPASSQSVAPAPALSSEAPPEAMTQKQAQQQQSEKQAAQQAVGKAVDKQLQQDKSAPVHRLGPSEHQYDKSLSPGMREQLQRVPDDPGGLLRRKFMLQYQQRQQQKGDS